MKKNLQSKVVAFSTAAALLGASAVARADDASTTGVAAITALGATGTTYITAAFGVAIIVAGGFWGIKMMKKAFSKAG